MAVVLASTGSGGLVGRCSVPPTRPELGIEVVAVNDLAPA